MVSQSDAAEAHAIRFLAARNLHQSIYLPATSSHERLRVTFATTSNFDDEPALPAVLFVLPMFACRWAAVSAHELSRECGVRMICIDRPGFGGSTSVPLSQRVPVWLESVPAVLKKLNVQHVSLISHSAGTIYSFNTVGQLRDILDPRAPYAAYLGPYVNSECSKATLTNFLKTLPTGMVRQWEGLARFINTNVMPVTSWSGGIFSASAAWFSSGPVVADAQDLSKAAKKYGVDNETAKAIERLEMEYLLAERFPGVNEEALLCLKKGEPGIWGVAEDYQQFARAVLGAEKARRKDDTSTSKLRIRLVFAESDVMSGDAGRKYMENVWNQEGIEEEIDVKSVTCPGTDHESVITDYEKGGLRAILKEIGELHVQ